MPELTTLPAELLHQIFAWLDPKDLGVLPRVNEAFHDYVKDNWKLCQDVYLNHLVSWNTENANWVMVKLILQDKPHNTDIDWTQALHDFVRLKVICERRAASDKV